MMTLPNVREIILALALFFNPLGYNELFALTMRFTHSYWVTSCIFYATASILLLVFFLLKAFQSKPDS